MKKQLVILLSLALSQVLCAMENDPKQALRIKNNYRNKQREIDEEFTKKVSPTLFKINPDNSKKKRAKLVMKLTALEKDRDEKLKALEEKYRREMETIVQKQKNLSFRRKVSA